MTTGGGVFVKRGRGGNGRKHGWVSWSSFFFFFFLFFVLLLLVFISSYLSIGGYIPLFVSLLSSFSHSTFLFLLRGKGWYGWQGVVYPEDSQEMSTNLEIEKHTDTKFQGWKIRIIAHLFIFYTPSPPRACASRSGRTLPIVKR